MNKESFYFQNKNKAILIDRKLSKLNFWIESSMAITVLLKRFSDDENMARMRLDQSDSVDS